MGLNYLDVSTEGSGVWFLDLLSYEEYDTFEDYSIGPFPGNSKWVFSLTGSTSVIETSGGFKQLKISGGTAASVDTNTDFSQGKEYWFQIYFSASNGTQTGGGGTLYVRVNGGSYTSFFSVGINANGTGNCETYILATFNSNNLWDVYAGGQKVLSDISSITSIGLRFVRSGDGSCILIIKDVRMSRIFKGG